MIITRDQMFENFAGNDQYPGLYNSINGNSFPKDIWITEYDIGLDDNDAFDKPYSNGWPHALYNLYTTLKYMTEVPNIDVLIQNNIVGYSGGYRLLDTYSYVDAYGTNNAFENIDGNLRSLVSHTFIGLSPKGELMRLPGIGDKLSDKLIAYRSVYGGFRTLDDLQSVKGIGVKTVAKLKPYAMVYD